MTPDADARRAYTQWQFEHDLTTRLLARCEAAERAILTQVGCPTDPVKIYAILSGAEPAPWPKRTRARDKQRATSAMHCLVLLGQVRQSIGLIAPNANKAAHDALLAGLYANDAAANAVLAQQTRQRARQGGQARAQQKTRAATRHDATIARLRRQWRQSDELQEQYGHRSPVNYIRHKTRLDVRTIQRALARTRQ